MTKFLHWRKMTWALLLWSAAMVTWLVVGDSGAALVGVLWLGGAAGLGLLWFMTQPPFRTGRGLGNGFFVRPGPGHWRVLNLHRAAF
jgi:hypothetical protein